MAENMAEECLAQDLLSSPAACKLINAIDAVEQHDPSSAQGDDHRDSSKRIPIEKVQLNMQTLFEECQQNSCTSSDTTLALKSLSEQSSVHLQVHRCILSSRCPFFQALFSTTWTEASSDQISVSTEECSGELATAVIGYLYTGDIKFDAGTAAEIVMLANLWQLPGLIWLVCQQLTTGPCQGFRRPTAPTDSVITDMPAMTVFSKAAFDGGIEHDSVHTLYQSCVGWLAKHSLLAWPTKAFAQLPAKIRLEVRAKASAMLNAVNALPQLEQADKLMARMPPAKWAADMQIAAKAWRGEVMQYISENFPKVALTSAFVERLQSEWTLEHLQHIAEALKVEYGASRAGYALEVYLGLQRLQSSAENGSFTEADEVKELFDGLKDHCWSYILRNWHLLQRTPTYKSIPVDQRQRLASDIKHSLSEITALDSPGDQSQSTGFSVLWDASNTQPDAAADNALTPDGKRPVSKATEKRRQRLAEEQERQRQEEEKRVLQQRRQQTVREIRHRQAAAAVAADRAAPSSAVQSEAGTGPSSRAVPGQRQQVGVGQGAAHGQQPVQARAGQRHHSTLQARAALPSAGSSRKLASHAIATGAVSAQSSQQQLLAERRLSLRTGSISSNSATPVQPAQSSHRSNGPNTSSNEHSSRHPRSTFASAQQQNPAAASAVSSSRYSSSPHSTVGLPQSVGRRSRPVPGAELPRAGQQSPVVAAQTAGRISAGHVQTASPPHQKVSSSQSSRGCMSGE